MRKTDMEALFGVLEKAKATDFSSDSTRLAVHYCGHMAGQGETPLEAEAVKLVEHEIRVRVAENLSFFAAGSLAGGADIMWVEAFLSKSVPVHVVLPFVPEVFLKTSVEAGGPEWAKRYWALIEALQAENALSILDLPEQPSSFSVATKVAMGFVLKKARHDKLRPVQWAVLSGESIRGHAGTAADVSLWQSMGFTSAIIDPRGETT